MCENPITIQHAETKELIKVKCGKCVICRTKKCRQWAIKLSNEGLYHKNMCMLTLTFRPKFLLRPKWKKLKKTKTKQLNDGTIKKEYIKYTTLISPKYITDVRLTGWLITLFIKKLRKEMDKKNIKFSYFAVGEHGTQSTHRAHWHILFFGIDKDILESVNVGLSKKNKEIFFSPIIDELWSYENMKIGHHTISEVTSATVKYVANYTMKKMYNNTTQSTYPTIMRFSNQSKIGTKWARKFHKEMRKGYIQDQDGAKYTIPESYLKEMFRYGSSYENWQKWETGEIIENLKEEYMIKLRNAGLLSLEEMKKKAHRIKSKLSKENRDTF